MQTQTIGPVHREMIERSRSVKARLYGERQIKSSQDELLKKQIEALRNEREFYRANYLRACSERDTAREVLTQTQEHLRSGNVVGAMVVLGLKLDDVTAPVIEIMKAVSKVSGVLKVDRHSERRNADLVRWRQIEMFLLKSRTNLSFPEIGRRMGGRDHSTVLHGVRKVEANFHQYAADIAKCEALL